MANDTSKRERVQATVDAIRKVLTTIDINIAPSSEQAEWDEALRACQSLDTFSALLIQDIKDLAGA